MPYGYLATVVIVAVCTLAAVRPPRRPRPLAVAAYLAGIVVNEAPLAVLVIFALSTAPAVAFDGLLATGSGRVLFGAAVATAAALLYLHLRIRRARPAVAAALGEPLPASAPWRSRLLPWPRRPRTVRRIADLRYGPDGRGHLLDLYRRRDLTGPAPTLVYLHGGGYFSGSKHREARALLHRMADRGWVAVSANYRLRPRAGFPEHLVDAKRVIAWVHDQADAYGMDPRTIVMAGSSAGAHLAALTALSPREPAFQPGFEHVDTHIAAAICLYGYYGRYYGRGADEQRASTPLAYDAHEAPPMLVVHGDHDNNTPVEGARALAEHVRAASARTVAYAELPGAQHGFDLLASERFEAVLDGVDVFLDRELPAVARRAAGHRRHTSG